MKKVGVLIGVLLGCCAVIGCGGGDDSVDSTAAGAGASNSKFVKQAEAICAQAGKRRDAAALAAFEAQREQGIANKPTKKRSEAVVTDAVLPPLARMADELAALSPPASEAAQATAVSTAFQQAVQEVEANVGLVVEGKLDAFKKPKRLAAEYGIEDCAEI